LLMNEVPVNTPAAVPSPMVFTNPRRVVFNSISSL
jgi:hypothetical protein